MVSCTYQCQDSKVILEEESLQNKAHCISTQRHGDEAQGEETKDDGLQLRPTTTVHHDDDLWRPFWSTELGGKKLAFCGMMIYVLVAHPVNIFRRRSASRFKITMRLTERFSTLQANTISF